jgi:tetratricopeptide (TPR) repeat protein
VKSLIALGSFWAAALWLAVTPSGPDPRLAFQQALDTKARGDLREAEVQLRTLSAGSPGWALPWIELSEVQLSLGAWDLARASIAQAAVLDNANPRVYHDRALAEQALGQLGIAEQDEAFAVKLRPEYSEAQANLAELWWRDGKRQEALAILEHLSDTYPDQLPYTVRLIDAYADLGHTVAAERTLRSLIARQPSSPVWHRRLSRLLAGEGLADEAAHENQLADRLSNQANRARPLRRLPNSKR